MIKNVIMLCLYMPNLVLSTQILRGQVAFPNNLLLIGDTLHGGVCDELLQIGRQLINLMIRRKTGSNV